MIYPGIGIRGFGRTRLYPLDGELQWIQHGLASIGAYAKDKGYNIELIDLRTFDSWENFQSTMIYKKPDVVGIGISCMNLKPALKTIDIVKDVCPDCKVVAGGVIPTTFSQKIQDNNKIDYIIQGEGEVAFTELLAKIVRNEPSSRIIRGIVPDLNDIPFVDRELFDYGRELNCFFAPWHPLPHITMIAGRGCPYNCSYCQPAEREIFGGKFRIREPQNVIYELELLRDRYKFKSITFWDDTFTVSKHWISQFCKLYKEEKFTAEIAANSRVDLICNNEDSIRELAEIGLNWLVVGFESGNQRILDLLSKGTTVEQNYQAAEICKKYGIKIFGTFMLGLPTETNKEVMDTVRLIRTVKPDHCSPFYFTPIPGTNIFDFCVKEDLLLRNDLFDIERSGIFEPQIKDIDYKFLEKVIKNL